MTFEPGFYHLHVHNISRGKGFNIHAAVAYRHGTRIPSMEAAAAYRQARATGNGPDAWDYRRKVGVEWVGIVAPDEVPAWMRESGKLWKAVDFMERRTNARLAREIVIGLHHKLSLEEHIHLLTTFAKAHCVDPYKLIADIAIHAPPTHKGGDPRNWHAHVLLTDRPADTNGFMARKDRRTTDETFVTALREGWTRVFNTRMEELGLPHRIDHRTLDKQRVDALQRGDEANAILLDRIPQNYLGKARHASHPTYEIFTERRDRLHRTLAINTERAEDHQRHTATRHQHAAFAAITESARLNAQRAAWRPPEPTLEDLQATYGRPAPTNLLGQLRAALIDAKADTLAMSLVRTHAIPSHQDSHLPRPTSILGLLLPMVKQTGPGHPVFTVTAKDFVFALYRLGITGIPELQNSLESIAHEEQRLFAARIAKKPSLRPPPPLPKSKPPVYPRPMQRLTEKLEARLGHVQKAVALHHERQVDFERRYIQRARQRADSHSLRRDPHMRALPSGYSRGRERTALSAPHTDEST